MMHTQRRSIVALFLSLAALHPTIATATVKVVKESAIVGTRVFDPAHPPKEIPALGEGENALTVCDYRCEVNSRFRVVDQKKGDDGVNVGVKIYSVTLTLRLNVTIWIPENAAPKLVAHEQGHRQIAEMIYESAERVAKTVAQKMDERRINGRGDTAQNAASKAMENLARDISNQYLDQTAVKAGRVNEIYDQLTSHGTRQTPAEPEAIKLAFANYDQERQAATTQKIKPDSAEDKVR